MAVEARSSSPELSEKIGTSAASSNILSGGETKSEKCNGVENPEQPEVAKKEYPTGAKFWLIIMSLLCVSILGGLDFSIIGVAVPAMTQEYNTMSDVAWYNVSYRLTACATQFAWGQLFTLFPLRPTFLSTIVIFLVGSAISASAPLSAVFILGRTITGVGSAGILTGLFATLAEVTPLHVRPIYTGVISGFEAIALIAAPILGGVLTQDVTWRWCFYINLPIGSAVIVALAFNLPNTKPECSNNLTWKELLYKLDIFGTLALIASIACLFMALSWAGTRFMWSQWQIIILLVFFVLCLAIFCYDQFKKGDSAALPPRLLKQRSVISATLFTFCLNGALGVLQYYLPIYFQIVRDYSPASSGYMLLPILVGFNIFLLAQGFLTTWLGYYVPHMILSSILTSIGAGLITTWTANTSLARVIVYQGIFGCGSGLAFEVPQIAAQAVLPEADATLGISITLFAQNFGGALFISVAQQVFSNRILAGLQGKVPGLSAETIQNLGLVDLGQSSFATGSQDVINSLEDAFIQTWYIAVVLSCLTAVFSLLMEWRSVKQTSATPPAEVLETIHG
ncbi:putative Major facilitator superfamily (MFS) profile domain-containing protein [Seiridium unicorne]|uniref:Major facilitator superfamily (MFS) profile domain-containing protein n=1 Tax=Seiridium unicorne TaxID=138068 RepID=A0ABR2URF3_9PEZI